MKKNIRDFLVNNKWLKGVPTSLTICNSLCGFAAILYTLRVYEMENPEPVLELSAWIILAAMIFDMFDGFTARLFNAASMHGLQMDSLADMVTFGVAPAVMVAITAHHLRNLKAIDYYLVWCLSAIYLGCAAYRLATYNVHAMCDDKKKTDQFNGLPTPGAASGICSLIIYYCMKEGEIKQIVAVLPFYAGFLGILMVSNVRYVHVGKWIQSVRRNHLRLLMLIVIICSILYWRSLAAVILINYYIISGPFIELYMRYKEKKEKLRAVS